MNATSVRSSKRSNEKGNATIDRPDLGGVLQLKSSNHRKIAGLHLLY